MGGRSFCVRVYALAGSTLRSRFLRGLKVGSSSGDSTKVWRSERARCTGSRWTAPGKKRRKDRKMPQGTVKWVNAEKGFGFIAPEDGSADVFVHYTEIQGSGFRTLEENQKVEFEVGQSPKGPQATGVRAV